MVLASAHLARPCSVLGPVDNPPWVRQTFLPFTAGALHWSRVRFDMAWQRRHVILPPAMMSVGCFDLSFFIVRGS
jgi:hypothetical protein